MGSIMVTGPCLVKLGGAGAAVADR